MVLNKKIVKNIIILLMAVFLTAGMLFMPKISVNFALSALNLWFTKMIPTLFPFMVVSGILIHMNLVKQLCAPISPLFSKLFGVNASGTFCIIIGFLCGFPMGAKVVADLYKKEELSLADADYLLSFCNLIGPIYFCGYVLVVLNISDSIPFLVGMYGIPALYGMLLFRLRKVFSIKKRYCKVKLSATSKDKPSEQGLNNTAYLQKPPGLMEAMDQTIFSAIENITKLGGYMIFFNLFNILPRMMMQKGLLSHMAYTERIGITYFFSCFFEISNGVSLVKNREPWLVLTMLPFGGLCCMAQTYSLIKDTPLSIAKYGIHKLVLTAVTGSYYFFVFRFLYNTI